jgi:hypothetical protein
MGYRSFLDPENRRWEVWLVIPTAAERRKEERRDALASTAAVYSAIERRTTPSRRKSSFFPRGSVVQAGYENGWLCFENRDGEKRRLVPVPETWEAASDEQLRVWCRVANRVLKCGP